SAPAATREVERLKFGEPPARACVPRGARQRRAKLRPLAHARVGGEGVETRRGAPLRGEGRVQTTNASGRAGLSPRGPGAAAKAEVRKKIRCPARDVRVRVPPPGSRRESHVQNFTLTDRENVLGSELPVEAGRPAG